MMNATQLQRAVRSSLMADEVRGVLRDGKKARNSEADARFARNRQTVKQHRRSSSAAGNAVSRLVLHRLGGGGGAPNDTSIGTGRSGASRRSLAAPTTGRSRVRTARQSSPSRLAAARATLAAGGGGGGHSPSSSYGIRKPIPDALVELLSSTRRSAHTVEEKKDDDVSHPTTRSGSSSLTALLREGRRRPRAGATSALGASAVLPSGGIEESAIPTGRRSSVLRGPPAKENLWKTLYDAQAKEDAEKEAEAKSRALRQKAEYKAALARQEALLLEKKKRERAEALEAGRAAAAASQASLDHEAKTNQQAALRRQAAKKEFQALMLEREQAVRDARARELELDRLAAMDAKRAAEQARRDEELARIKKRELAEAVMADAMVRIDEQRRAMIDAKREDQRLAQMAADAAAKEEASRKQVIAARHERQAARETSVGSTVMSQQAARRAKEVEMLRRQEAERNSKLREEEVSRKTKELTLKAQFRAELDAQIQAREEARLRTRQHELQFARSVAHKLEKEQEKEWQVQQAKRYEMSLYKRQLEEQMALEYQRRAAACAPGAMDDVELTVHKKILQKSGVHM